LGLTDQVQVQVQVLGITNKNRLVGFENPIAFRRTTAINVEL
jgi:hypothetical protein